MRGKFHAQLPGQTCADTRSGSVQARDKTSQTGIIARKEARDTKGEKDSQNQMRNASNVPTLKTLLGDYPNTLALKRGEVRSPNIVFDFADVKVPETAFEEVVRHLKYDVAELATSLLRDYREVDGVCMPCNKWRTASVIERIEKDTGKPVLTNARA